MEKFKVVFEVDVEVEGADCLELARDAACDLPYELNRRLVRGDGKSTGHVANYLITIKNDDALIAFEKGLGDMSPVPKKVDRIRVKFVEDENGLDYKMTIDRGQ